MKIFIKYRTNHSWGSTKWEYTDIEVDKYYKKKKDEKEVIQNFVDEIDSHYDFSDKYRGCDVKIIKPTKNFLESKIRYLECMIKEYKEIIKYYKKLLPKAKSELLKECPKCFHYSEKIITETFKRAYCKEGHYAFLDEELEKRKKEKLTCPDMKKELNKK